MKYFMWQADILQVANFAHKLEVCASMLCILDDVLGHLISPRWLDDV